MRPSLVAQMKIAGENIERGDLTEEALSKIDMIAPIQIIQQLLKTPYLKSCVSIAVQRAGQIVVLNPGPDVEESEKLTGKRPKNVGVSFQNYAEASLRLSRVSQQVPTLTWFEAWLDNVMASVPELAICNHLNGVVQGYELLPDGISGDAPAFDPNVVQQNCLAVLRFLQSNCKEDPGVYWLYKSAGEDVIQLFDLSTISKNHSSSASSFPLVVRACAHEQFARLILNNEEEFDLTIESNNVQRKFNKADLEEESLDPVMNSTSGTSLDIGPVCQDPAPLLQTTTSPISSQRAAVHHVIQAIKSLMGTRQLMSSEQKVEWLPTSKVDRKLWSLVLLLGESYLSLGEAYKEDGQLHQALNIIELACSIYGSMPHKFGETFFASAMYKSFSLLLKIQKFEEWVNKEPLTTQVEDYTSLRGLSSTHLFWAKVWLVVGEIYVKFYLLLSPESEIVTKEEVPSHIAAEVEMLKKKLPACRKKCVSCSLVSCLCLVQKKEDKSQNMKSKEVRGGIFKYLTRSRKNGAERYLFTALDCFEHTQKAFPRGCKELLQSLYQRKGWVWCEIAKERLNSKKIKEAEDAFANAVEAFKGCSDHTNAISSNCKFGVMRRDRALEMQRQMEYGPGLNAVNAFNKAVKAVVEEFMASLRYYMAAKRELSLAIEEGSSVPEDARVEVTLRLGDVYLLLGHILSVGETTAAAPPELKIISESTHSSSPDQFSAGDFLREALAVYKSFGESKKYTVADTYNMLAVYHKDCCLRFSRTNDIDKANDHAVLANEYWQGLMDCFGPENLPRSVLIALVKRSMFNFDRPRQSNFMIESDLPRFLECCHISEEEEKKIPRHHLKNFWAQLQKILKEMLTMTKSLSVSEGANKSGTLRKLYNTSLRATTTSLGSLKEMHDLWTSES